MPPALEVALAVAGAQHLKGVLPSDDGQPLVEAALQLGHSLVSIAGLGLQILDLRFVGPLRQLPCLLELWARTGEMA